jgi:hypothetical protein
MVLTLSVSLSSIKYRAMAPIIVAAIFATAIAGILVLVRLLDFALQPKDFNTVPSSGLTAVSSMTCSSHFRRRNSYRAAHPISPPNGGPLRHLRHRVQVSVMAGHYRYAHVTSLRCDEVNPPLLGTNKLVSHSLRRNWPGSRRLV